MKTKINHIKDCLNIYYYILYFRYWN